MSEKPLKIAIIIPVFNRKNITLNCLKQLQAVATEGAELTVVVVDDGSTDGTNAAIKSDFPETVVLTGDGNLWWSGAINMGVEYALKSDFDFVLCINDDIEFDDAFIVELLRVAERTPNALVGSISLYKTEDGREQIISAGFVREGTFQTIESPLAGKYLEQINAEDVLQREILTGSSLLIPIQVFEKIGLFNAKNYPHNWGDFEFSLRAFLNGFPCLIVPRSKIYLDGNNPNYYKTYAVNSTRLNYVKNTFEKYKYNYGFFALWRQCFMHRPKFKAIILFGWKLMGVLRGILLKTFLPHALFKAYIENK